MNNNHNQQWISLGLQAEEYIRGGNIDLAKHYLQKSIDYTPDKPWPYFLLASITEDNDEAIEIIKATKNIHLTEWYYISLIEKYYIEIEKLKKDFLQQYGPHNLVDESAIIHWKQLHGFSKWSDDIVHDITFEDISPISNTWDCICLLCTGKEHIDNTYVKFLDYLYSTIDIEIASQLHFKLVIKTKDCDIYIIPQKMQKIFKTSEYLLVNIEDELDIYDDKQETKIDQNIIDKYGSKYGPNVVFFDVVQQLSQYNTSLLLECDCLLSDNWMNRIKNYVATQGFLISGSQSDSPNTKPYHDLRNQHINGGTALYATGNILFQKFMSLCRALWPRYIKYYGTDLPYDYIILLTIQNYFNTSQDKNNHNIWSYIKKHYIYNSLIFNYSDTTYNDYDPRILQKIYDPAILHQKPPDYPGVRY